jgi:hypothetical protein
MKLDGVSMSAFPDKLLAVGKLAIAGEKAGFTIDQMIDLLNSGVSVQTLLGLIEMRLSDNGELPNPAITNRWIM